MYCSVLRQQCLLHQLIKAKMSRDHQSLERVIVDLLAQFSKSISHEGGMIEVLFVISTHDSLLISLKSIVTSSPMSTNGAQNRGALKSSDSRRHFIARLSDTLALFPSFRCW